MRRLSRFPAFLLAAALAGGCVEFNEECSRFMDDPDKVAGYLGGDVDITKPVVRTEDNAIGQLVAESYYEAFNEQALKFWPDLAIVNSGAIRSEGVCESREVLSKGPVKRKVLRDVLPFDNRVVAVSITHEQLKNILEHSVASYSTTDPKGSYLQVHGIEFWVNCSLPGEKLNSDGTRASAGQRVTRIVLHRRSCEQDPTNPECGQSVDIPVDPPSSTEIIRVAIDSYLQGGGDGFLDFKDVDPNANDTVSAGSFNFEVVARYFSQAYPESAPLPAEADDRVHLSECR